MVRWIAVALVLAVGALAYVAWKNHGAPAPSGTSSTPAMPPAGSVPQEEMSHGLAWDVPTAWSQEGDRPMRIATYAVPGKGGAKPAECAVFYFGPGQGGDVESNISRWIEQFEHPGPAQRSSSDVNGIQVSRVTVNGTYLAPSGPNMESSGQFKDYMLLGAIAEGPNGSVFFKLTGPKKTVEAARGDFDRMVGSLRRS